MPKCSNAYSLSIRNSEKFNFLLFFLKRIRNGMSKEMKTHAVEVNLDADRSKTEGVNAAVQCKDLRT